MRRIALVLATVGLVATAATAAVPARAQAAWWGGERGYHEAWQQHEWREHHGRHFAVFERHIVPRAVLGLFHHR